MSGNGQETKIILTITKTGENFGVKFEPNVSFKDLAFAFRLANLQLDNMLIANSLPKKPAVIIPQAIVPQKELDKIRNRFNA